MSIPAERITNCDTKKFFNRAHYIYTTLCIYHATYIPHYIYTTLHTYHATYIPHYIYTLSFDVPLIHNYSLKQICTAYILTEYFQPMDSKLWIPFFVRYGSLYENTSILVQRQFRVMLTRGCFSSPGVAFPHLNYRVFANK